MSAKMINLIYFFGKVNCGLILGNFLSKISIFAPEFRFEDSDEFYLYNISGHEYITKVSHTRALRVKSI